MTLGQEAVDSCVELQMWTRLMVTITCLGLNYYALYCFDDTGDPGGNPSRHREKHTPHMKAQAVQKSNSRPSFEARTLITQPLCLEGQEVISQIEKLDVKKCPAYVQRSKASLNNAVSVRN